MILVDVGVVVGSRDGIATIRYDGDSATVMSKLELLDLSGNVFSLPEPSVVSALPQLQELYLRRMKLHEFPNGLLGLKQLQILDLSQNSLTTVPEGIKNFTFLIELDMSHNNITSLPPEPTFYGFVDYYDRRSSALAILTLNGREIFGQPIRVNWAYASGQREDTTDHFNIFAGDLSPEVTDSALFSCFLGYSNLQLLDVKDFAGLCPVSLLPTIL